MAGTAVKIGGAREIEPGDDLILGNHAGEAALPAVRIGSEKSQPELEERISIIADRLETLAQEQVSAKSSVEERWLRNIRAFHGYYDASTEADLKERNVSRAFVKATRSKTVALEARLFDLIFPTDDRNWGIEATPVPKLGKEAKEATKRAENAAEQANEAEAQGHPEQAAQIVEAGDDEAQRAKAANEAIEAARKAADLMQDEMDDQLVESRYPAESRDLIRDACKLGTGILKGPIVNERTRGRWVPTEDDVAANYELIQSEDVRPRMRRVDPWSFFPDMSAQKIEDAEFTFERYLWTNRDLRKAVQEMGFNADAVRRILGGEKDGKPPKHVSGLNYLTQLRSITGEGEGGIKGRKIGWEYHGPLECEEVSAILEAMGEPELALEYAERDDPLEEFRVVVFFCEGEILKIAPEYPLDSGDTLYSVFNVEESEGSIFGYGIPHIMEDSQNALNSSWRMGLDNAALSVGPQAVIDKDGIEPADGSWTMVPKKVWHRTKAQVPNSSPPVEFFNVPNNMQEISTIIEIALQFIDMETGIPMPQQGDQTSDQTKTVGGMTILQNAANIIFRRMVKNYDDGIIAPTMRRLYDWNMQFSQRAEIKGDMQIDARGTAVLLLKEVQAQNLMFIVTQLMSHPAVQPMLKPYQNVLKLFQSMMISPADVMVTEDEYNANMKKLAEQEQPPSDAQINAQARIEAANIAAQTSEVRNETQLMVMQIRERIELIELAQQEGLTMEELRNRLQIKEMDNQHKERVKAIEIATEDERARQAQADGRDEVEAVGQGIG